jgi:hypothetical protein
MKEMPNLFGRVTSVLSDHARLKETVQQLQAASSPALTVARDSLRELTAGFAVQLRAHFSAEETDGNFGEICRQRPDLVEIIGLRKNEHDQMRQILQDLDGSVARMDVPDLATVVIALLHLLERHEVAESTLMRHFMAWSRAR